MSTNRSVRLQLQFAVLVIALMALSARDAFAKSGTIGGTLKFFQAQGGYCNPPGGKDGEGDQTCDAYSLYTEAELWTEVPVALTVLHVTDETNTIIGTGSTDVFGQFTITWSRGTVPSSVSIKWRHVDNTNAFMIRGATGGVLADYYGPWQVCNGCTTTLGTITVGSASVPDGAANLYNGAQKTYYNALQYSPLMVSSFTGVQIWYGADDPGCTDSGACAKGSNIIEIVPPSVDKSWRAPEGVISHEMGHIASYVALPYRISTRSYCYPAQEQPSDGHCTDTSKDGWSPTTPEWRGVALEEARATFYGTVAFYWYGAADPRTCASASWCAASGNLEKGPTFCKDKIGRSAQQIWRYLWDTYDTTNEGADTHSISYSDQIWSQNSIPFGYNQNQAESAYQNSGPTVDCWDCFTAGEWRANMIAFNGQDTKPEYDQNQLGCWQ